LSFGLMIRENEFSNKNPYPSTALPIYSE